MHFPLKDNCHLININLWLRLCMVGFKLLPHLCQIRHTGVIHSEFYTVCPCLIYRYYMYLNISNHSVTGPTNIASIVVF